MNTDKKIRMGTDKRNKIKFSALSVLLLAVLASDSAYGEGLTLFRRLEQEARGLRLERDPFALGAVISTDISPDGLRLSGIVWDQQSPRAIINDAIVGPGDRIGPNIVVEIRQDRVILFDGRSHLELKLAQ